MKVAVVTGTRAEYGIWRPVLRALGATRGLGVQLVVTGMHLLPEFGGTVREITRDGRREGWSVAARVPMYQKGDEPAESLARGIAGMARTLGRLQPDLVFVLGDRLEILAAACAALTRRVPIAHLHGGETAPAQWDEQIRHAVTKMAQLHFCATEAARERILRMGEDPRRVHLVGAPALDEARVFLKREGKRATAAAPGPRALVVLHPTSPDESVEFARARMMLGALGAAGIRDVLASGPNNDPGHRGILRAYRAAGVPMVMSLTQQEFWREMASRRILVGNSSSGIIEAATFRCAVVNIGDRQGGRERNGNVLDVPWKAQGIRAALRRVLSDRAYGRRVASGENLYGDGGAARRIARIVRGVDLAALRAPKQFCD